MVSGGFDGGGLPVVALRGLKEVRARRGGVETVEVVLLLCWYWISGV